jgi:hypothetical protein
MYCLVNVDHNGMTANLTWSNCEEFWEVLYILCNDGTDDMLWNGSEEDGNVWHVRKMKAVTVNMETVTLTSRYMEYVYFVY